MRPRSRVAAVVLAAALLFVGPAQNAPAQPSHDECARLTGARLQACAASLLGARYNVMDMGVADYGGGPRSHHAHMGGTSLVALRAPDGPPAESFTLTAARARTVLGGHGQNVLTFNGTTPGPTLTVTQGDLVEVRLENLDVPRGVTIHFHGVDLPGSQDGVAGVTQNAVLPGQSFTYRFVVPDAGTYWYHSHQDSVNQVGMGLVGALVVLPRPTDPPAPPPARPVVDVVALGHTYGLTTTINGSADPQAVITPADITARVRYINSDNGPAIVTASAPFRVVAIDGFDVTGGGVLTDTYAVVPAGGRIDLAVDVDQQPVRVGLLTKPSLVIGPETGIPPPPLSASHEFDALKYGTPNAGRAAERAMGKADRHFTYRVGQQIGYLNGHRGLWFTINDGIIPKVPMFVVSEGDVVRYRVINDTNMTHPMHLHGHHALVVARNGHRTAGAAWWIDSLEVDPGQTYELLFVADNPGIWMFHCHNLPHARQGLMTHLVYEGVRTPFDIGRINRRLVNQPE